MNLEVNTDGGDEVVQFELGKWVWSQHVTGEVVDVLVILALTLSVTTLFVYILHHAPLILGKKHKEHLHQLNVIPLAIVWG